jgi:hypothetical protein
MVSGNFFAGMQVVPVIGRPISAADDQVQDGAPTTIVGVTPRGFTGASSAQITPNLFVPLLLSRCCGLWLATKVRCSRRTWLGYSSCFVLRRTIRSRS